jgi:malate dehydrogenase (oxaloacetate-decarboxylating)
MEGKAALFKRFANVDAFPICLDTQDTEEIIKAVKQIAPVFGGINLEDIAAPKCFEIEARLKTELNIPVMHDDQHGTAVVVLAALINALRLRGTSTTEATVVINGAGAAGTAIAELLLLYGFIHITILDSRGVISKNRTDLNPEKLALLEKISSSLSLREDGFASPKQSHAIEVKIATSETPRNDDAVTLADAVKNADVFIGVSKAGLLTQAMVRTMGERPIICALANPVPEIMPDIAKAAGAYIVATGRSDFPNQINNVLAFPGIFRGALDNNIAQITNAMLVKAAEALAGLVQNPTVDEILPSPFNEQVVPAVAKSIH